MIRAPSNPQAEAARAAMQAHNAEVKALTPSVAVVALTPCETVAPAYRLTWPGDQRGVCCIAGQWRRNEAGDVEAWYSAPQLGAAIETMQGLAADGAAERQSRDERNDKLCP